LDSPRRTGLRTSAGFLRWALFSEEKRKKKKENQR
jgi:hypothetical protein